MIIYNINTIYGLLTFKDFDIFLNYNNKNYTSAYNINDIFNEMQFFNKKHLSKIKFNLIKFNHHDTCFFILIFYCNKNDINLILKEPNYNINYGIINAVYDGDYIYIDNKQLSEIYHNYIINGDMRILHLLNYIVHNHKVFPICVIDTYDYENDSFKKMHKIIYTSYRNIYFTHLSTVHSNRSITWTQDFNISNDKTLYFCEYIVLAYINPHNYIKAKII